MHRVNGLSWMMGKALLSSEISADSSPLSVTIIFWTLKAESRFETTIIISMYVNLAEDRFDLSIFLV